jgi:hypothetical protein
MIVQSLQERNGGLGLVGGGVLGELVHDALGRGHLEGPEQHYTKLLVGKGYIILQEMTCLKKTHTRPRYESSLRRTSDA